MTLHDTIRSILQGSLDWAKSNRDYWGSIREKQRKELKFQWSIVQYRFTRIWRKIEKFMTGGE